MSSHSAARLTRRLVALPRSPSIRVVARGVAEYGQARQAAESGVQTTRSRGAASTGHSCQAALEPTPSEPLPILAAFSTLGLVRRTLRVTRRRAWGSTNLSTAGIHGQRSPPQSVR